MRLDVLVSLDPVPLVQEIAAVNAHGGPSSETCDVHRLGPDPRGPKGKLPLIPVDFGDNSPSRRARSARDPGNALFVHEARDQTQEGLVLWVHRATAQKGADVEV